MGSDDAETVTSPRDDVANRLVSRLRSRIADAADPRRAPGMQAYMKSTMPFRGVSAGPLHRMCREVLDSHRLADRVAWERAVRDLWDGAAYREERYAAIALTGHRLYREFQDAATLPLYRHLVETGAWWDLVDDVAVNRVGPILRADPVVASTIRSWAHDPELWVRRTAVLAQLKARSATDTALLADVLGANLQDSAHGRDFFIRKAVGWALREYSRSDPAWVVAFVTEHESQMAGLTRREALRRVGEPGTG